MKVKLYDNTEIDIGFGILLSGINAGELSYLEMPEVKEMDLLNDGIFVPNPGYDLQIAKDNRLAVIEPQLVDLNIEKDKATTLGYTTLVTELTDKITVLDAERATLIV